MTASFTLLVLSSKDRGASSPSILYPKEESGSHCLLILDLKPRSAGLKFGSTIDHSSRSWVIVPLNDTLIRLIGEPDNDNYDERIFTVPHYNICNLYLRKWVKAAGIRKKITWHCARHSFAVNVLTKGANIKTVSSLLGHTSIKMTERYLHVVDSLKQDAINSLGEINYAPI